MKATIQLSKLRLDGGTQPRVKIDHDVVSDYVERMKAGDDFPPVDVFHDGKDHWLAEGFHRVYAAKERGDKTVPCTIRKGTLRDAVLFSCGANASHGMRRTNPDKRKAVMTLLQDDEWSKFSDRKIAELCCVDHTTVGDYRRQLGESPSSNGSEKRTGRDGKSRSTPKTNGKPANVATVDETEFDEPEKDDEPEVQPAKAKTPESNVIGQVIQEVIDYIEGVLEDRPPHVQVAVRNRFNL